MMYPIYPYVLKTLWQLQDGDSEVDAACHHTTPITSLERATRFVRLKTHRTQVTNCPCLASPPAQTKHNRAVVVVVVVCNLPLCYYIIFFR